MTLDHETRIGLRREINAAVRRRMGLCPRCGQRECEPGCGRVAVRRGSATRRWTEAEILEAVADVARSLGRETISRNLYEIHRDPSKHPSSYTVSTRVGTDRAFGGGR